MSYPSLDSIIIFLKSPVTVANKPVWEEYSFILFASAEISLASTLAFIETASGFLPFKSNKIEQDKQIQWMDSSLNTEYAYPS